MRVEEVIPMKRIRKSLPKTMDAIRSTVVDRVQSVARSEAVAKARKAVRRGSDETVKWVRRNPRKASLAGLGLGGALATWMLVRARRKPRRSMLMQRAMKVAGNLPSGAGRGRGQVHQLGADPEQAAHVPGHFGPLVRSRP